MVTFTNLEDKLKQFYAGHVSHFSLPTYLPFPLSLSHKRGWPPPSYAAMFPCPGVTISLLLSFLFLSLPLLSRECSLSVSHDIHPSPPRPLSLSGLRRRGRLAGEAEASPSSHAHKHVPPKKEALLLDIRQERRSCSLTGYALPGQGLSGRHRAMRRGEQALASTVRSGAGN